MGDRPEGRVMEKINQIFLMPNIVFQGVCQSNLSDSV